ncbi:hypothetical protein MNBD_GAMMA21-1084 [hydrothermal vent metagenome]|uniref:Type 4 fimbrial biogenesis protein PilX N-terminal domain-containing protein n=1 Tax=hydrothermal vent metagenome TaxID=652676 RepID=A0A3B1AFZ8_9ZZZZ
MNNPSIGFKGQTGSALIVSLSILLVLTILGVSSLRTTSLEEKMAGNSRDAQTAFEAAEAALREGERFVITSLDTGDYNPTGGNNGATGLFDFGDVIIVADAWSVETNWDASNFVTVPYNNLVARLPRYMIQLLRAQSTQGQAADLGNANDYVERDPLPKFFQITSRGTGISPNSRAMLQSYFSK